MFVPGKPFGGTAEALIPFAKFQGVRTRPGAGWGKLKTDCQAVKASDVVGPHPLISKSAALTPVTSSLKTTSISSRCRIVAPGLGMMVTSAGGAAPRERVGGSNSATASNGTRERYLIMDCVVVCGDRFDTRL